MACTLVSAAQLEADVLLASELDDSTGAAGVGINTAGWTEITGATLQAVLDDIDDVLAARTEAFVAAGDLLYRGASAPAVLTLGTEGYFLKAGASAPEWAVAPGSSPLTTKGDLFTYSTVDARLGVGTDGYMLNADSGETTGLIWFDWLNADNIFTGAPTFRGNVTMAPSAGTSDFSLRHRLSLTAITTAISTGVLTAEATLVVVAAESGTADDLDSMVGALHGEYRVLTADASDTITIKEDVGSDGFLMTDSAEIAISTGDYIAFLYNGTKWVECWRSIQLAGSSPLTTKGDIFGYSTTDARRSVGSNGYALVADSGDATGLNWATHPSEAVKGSYGIELLSLSKDGATSWPMAFVEGQTAPGNSSVPAWEAVGGAEQDETYNAPFGFTVPRGYVTATHTLTVRFRARFTEDTSGAGEALTIDCGAYEDGIGSDLDNGDGPYNLTSAWANYDFTISDTTLVAGDFLILWCLFHGVDGTGGNGWTAQCSQVEVIVG